MVAKFKIFLESKTALKQAKDQAERGETILENWRKLTSIGRFLNSI